MMRTSALFLAAIIITADAGFLIASDPYGLTTQSIHSLLRVALWLATAAYLGTLVESMTGPPLRPGEVLSGSGIFAIALIPFARIVHETLNGRSAGIALVFAGGLAIFALVELTSEKLSAFQYLAGGWALLTTLLIAGQNPWFPFARGIVQSMRSIHWMLDLRIALSAIFVSVLFVKAIRRAAGQGTPPIDDLPLLHVPPPEADWHPLLIAVATPLLNIAEAVGRALQVLLNVLWKFVATIGIFFARVGEALAELIGELLETEYLLESMLRVTAASLLLLLHFYLCFTTVPILTDYVRSGFGIAQAGLFLMIAVLFLLLGVCATAILWLLSRDLAGRGLSLIAASVFTSFVAVGFISGLVLVILSRIQQLGLEAMRAPGIFSWLLILVLAGSAARWMTIRMSRTEPIEKAPSV